MVNNGVAARHKRRYDFHPYSVNVTDVGKTITSSPSSTIIKSESWENEQTTKTNLLHYGLSEYRQTNYCDDENAFPDCRFVSFFFSFFGALVFCLFLTQVSVLSFFFLLLSCVCVQQLTFFFVFVNREKKWHDCYCWKSKFIHLELLSKYYEYKFALYLDTRSIEDMRFLFYWYYALSAQEFHFKVIDAKHFEIWKTCINVYFPS